MGRSLLRTVLGSRGPLIGKYTASGTPSALEGGFLCVYSTGVTLAFDWWEYGALWFAGLARLPAVALRSCGYFVASKGGLEVVMAGLC
jgi:hypothetical protein